MAGTSSTNQDPTDCWLSSPTSYWEGKTTPQVIAFNCSRQRFCKSLAREGWNRSGLLCSCSAAPDVTSPRWSSCDVGHGGMYYSIYTTDLHVSVHADNQQSLRSSDDCNDTSDLPTTPPASHTNNPSAPESHGSQTSAPVSWDGSEDIAYRLVAAPGVKPTGSAFPPTAGRHTRLQHRMTAEIIVFVKTNTYKDSTCAL